jgi:hypothetical protein
MKPRSGTNKNKSLSALPQGVAFERGTPTSRSTSGLWRMFLLWIFHRGNQNKENCVLKIADGGGQVKRFLLHFWEMKKFAPTRNQL